MRVYGIAERLRTILLYEGELATVLRGAGIALIIRVLASAVGYATIIVLARWMGSSEYGRYSFAIAWMTLLAYPATLGLSGPVVRFVSQYAAARDWEQVVGLLKMSSWLAFGCGTGVALIGILTVLSFKSYLDPGYFAPMIVALAGIPVVALALVRSEAIRGLGWLGIAWGPLQLGQPLLLLFVTVAMVFIEQELSATIVVGASILAYATMLIAQWRVFHARLGTKIRAKPKINVRLWLGAALPFVWIYVASTTLSQSPVIMIGFFLRPHDVAVYSAAAATSGVVSFLLEATNALSAPKFAVLHARERQGELQTLVTDITRWTFWPSLAVALILVAFGPTILRLFGPGFEQGSTVLAILTLGQLVNAFTGPVAMLLNMTGHQNVTARVLGINAILGAGLGRALTQIWGIIGTAVAFSAAIVLWNAWLWGLVVRKLEIYPSLLRPCNSSFAGVGKN
ncbi:MAG: oligosaccharide flippase family protein [Methyloceanibacter sp.]